MFYITSLVNKFTTVSLVVSAYLCNIIGWPTPWWPTPCTRLKTSWHTPSLLRPTPPPILSDQSLIILLYFSLSLEIRFITNRQSSLKNQRREWRLRTSSRQHFAVGWRRPENLTLKKRLCVVLRLLPLRPVSLTHKNPQRRKIIHGMRPLGRKEQSIDRPERVCL